VIDRWLAWCDALRADFLAWLNAIEDTSDRSADAVLCEISPARSYLDSLAAVGGVRYLHLPDSDALTSGPDWVRTLTRTPGLAADTALDITSRGGGLWGARRVVVAGLGIDPGRAGGLAQLCLREEVPMFLAVEDWVSSPLHTLLANFTAYSNVHLRAELPESCTTRIHDVIRMAGREALVAYATGLFPEVSWSGYIPEIERALQPFCQMDGTWVVPAGVALIQHHGKVATP